MIFIYGHEEVSQVLMHIFGQELPKRFIDLIIFGIDVDYSI